MKSKVLKYSVLLILVAISIGGIYYLNLSSRHKAIIKTRINHTLGLVDNTWNIKIENNSVSLITPTLVVDQVYKSMEGPKVMRSFQINPKNDDLVWITSFETKAISTNEVDRLSNDYVCHTNIDFYDGEHYSRWNLNERIGQHYPRLTSMSNGIETYKFPKGFGFPVFENENLFLSTQALNHNIKSEPFSVKHKVTLGYQPNDKKMKSLQSKTVFVMLPYDANNPFQGPTENNPNMCLPVETGNHSYKNKDGESLSGHWVVFPGRETYSYDITQQLQLKDSTTMHHIATHLHPYAETLTLKDKTMDSVLFTSKAENYTDKIGLKSVSTFSSEEGVMLYPDHNYELVLKTNNTSDVNQDMMASMFVFLFDKEMDEKLKAYNAQK
ncbi:hypothetical protein [Winogradskyella sp.]|uniref:hypothetical protein n=1 Tax=Winogradskyella sp. TaxID=1883156 RepID=UPI0025EA147D|nr:hypothetical protein [Winogradskyella sp.]